MTHILMKEQLMATKFSPDQLSEIIDKQLARPGVLAVLLLVVVMIGEKRHHAEVLARRQ